MSEQLSVIDPLSVNDVVGFTAAAGARMYYDSTGTLQTAGANQLRMSYSPDNLDRAPLPMIEAAATNLALYSSDFTNAAWVKAGGGTGAAPVITADAGTAPDGTNAADRIVCARGAGASAADYSTVQQDVALASGTAYTSSIYLKSNTGADQLVALYAGATSKVVTVTSKWQRFYVSDTTTGAAVATLGIGTVGAGYNAGGNAALDLLAWTGQIETGASATSPIPTTGAAVTRPADVLDDKQGILYTSVPENDHPAYDPTKTYGKGEFCISPTTHRIYRSEADNNLNHDPTDVGNQVSSNGSTVWWFDYDPTNRWAMFDDEGNTQTAVDSPMIVSLRAGGWNASWLGALDAEYLSFVVQDEPGGNIIFETSSTLEASKPADYLEYFFSPFRPMHDFLVTDIDQYTKMVVTVMLKKKSGGKVKCGMWAVGDHLVLGRTQYGVKIKPKTYATIDTNKFGKTRITRRKSATDMDVTAKLAVSEGSHVGRTLRSLLDKAVVVIGAGSELYEDLRVFGLINGEVEYDTPDECTLSVNAKGMI